MAGGRANWRCPPATIILEPKSRIGSTDLIARRAPYAGGIGTHYDVLGVAPDAPPEQVRSAYRERARRHHPDRGQPSDIGAMAVVNEAYRVLGDPARRFEYDRSLRQGAPTSSTDTEDTEVVEPVDDVADHPIMSPTRLIPAGPARVPWKMMLIAAAVGSAVILIAAMFNDPPSTEVPDGILRTGSCVAVEANGDVREVACTNVDDITVDLVLPTGAICPGEMGAYRDRLGLGTVCIEFD